MAVFNCNYGMLDFSIRGNRRKGVSFIIAMLLRICEEEYDYVRSIQDKLQEDDGGAYYKAEESLDSLRDAIDALMGAY